MITVLQENLYKGVKAVKMTGENVYNFPILDHAHLHTEDDGWLHIETTNLQEVKRAKISVRVDEPLNLCVPMRNKVTWEESVTVDHDKHGRPIKANRKRSKTYYPFLDFAATIGSDVVRMYHDKERNLLIVEWEANHMKSRSSIKCMSAAEFPPC